jgi:zinc protease
VLLAVALGLPGIAGAWEPGADLSFSLDNGVQATVTAWPGEQVAAVVIRVDAGSRDDPDYAPQLAHLVEHLMFRVHHGEADVAARLADLGAVSNAFTGPDSTSYVVVVPAANLDEVLALEAARFGGLPGGIDESDVAAEREILLREESERTVDNPWGELGPLIMQRLFPSEHPYHLDRSLDVETFGRIGLADVERFWTARYDPASLRIAVVGDVEPAAVQVKIASLFGQLEARPVAARPHAERPEEVAGRFHYVQRSSDWSWLYLSWVTPAAHGIEGRAFGLLEPLLLDGAHPWLLRELYEDDAVVRAAGSWQRYDLAGVFTLEIAYPSSSSLAEVLSALRSGLARMDREGVALRDLQIATWQTWLASREALESPLALASWLARHGANADRRTDPWAERVESLKEVRVADVERALRTWIKPEGMSIVLAGPRLELPARSVWDPLTGADLDLDDEDDEHDDDDDYEEDD